MKIVIVGGVAGGATAAARIRRLDESAEIVILERTGFISYANCGLPYYVGDVITDKEKLTLQTPESFRRRFDIDVRVHNKVTSVDKSAKTVCVTRLDDGSSYTEHYDELILSPGARAVKPPFSGVDNDRVFTLRTVEDTFAIKEFTDRFQGGRAVVVGGGFIGLEMTENLLERGFGVTLLQRGTQVMPPLDFDMATGVHAYLRSHGVDLRFGRKVEGFIETDEGISVSLEDGTSIDADFVLLCVGVSPDSHLALEAGLDMGMHGSIKVDSHMRTSDPSIYAVGDAVEFANYVTGQPVITALAGPAIKQGRIAADNICGIPHEFSGAQGSSVLKLFDMVIATTGINEKTARAAGIAFDKVIISSLSHATYYPGASKMTVKTLFEPESGRILGAQIVGFEGVDKRIDVMAVAIRAGMTGADLTELDLAYAPPFSSAREPANMVGFVIENVLSGLVAQIHWDEIENLQKSGAQLVDVSTEREFAEGHISGAVNIPLDQLRERIDEIDAERPVYFNCSSGLRSYVASRIVSGHGIVSYNLSGGYRFYHQIMEDLAHDATPAHGCGLPVDT